MPRRSIAKLLMTALAGLLMGLPARAEAPDQLPDRILKRQSLAWLYEPFLARMLDLRPREYELLVEQGSSLLSPDGTRLVADIYRPDKPSPSPTILIRIPLDDNETGALFSELLGSLWASRGYNVMIQGVRGRFGSDGQHVPFQTETEDGLATLRWLKQQPWHNGHTGMWGGSYFGYTQWALADQREAEALGLDALFIQIASTDHQALFHPGGAFAYETALFWATRSHSEVDTVFSHERLIAAMQAGGPADADLRVVGRPIPFYRDWLQHARKGAFWAAADGQGRAAKLRMPALLMAGWYDPFLPGQLADYRAIQEQGSARMAYASRLIIGPWSHAETMAMPEGYLDEHYRLASLRPALDWYDQHLLGRKLHPFAPVRLFIGGINRWRDEQEWPLKRTRYIPIYLSGGQANGLAGKGRLSFAPGPSASDQFTHDPARPVPSLGGAILLAARSGPWLQNAVEARDDVLVYSSDPLASDLELTGELKARLKVACETGTADFVVKLVDVHPDGKAYGISQGILRGSYRGGTASQIEVALWPLGHVFLKGHRLRVEVSGSHFPMFDVAPGATGNPIKQTLSTGGEDSFLLLPVIDSAS